MICDANYFGFCLRGVCMCKCLMAERKEICTFYFFQYKYLFFAFCPYFICSLFGCELDASKTRTGAENAVRYYLLY